MQVTLRKNNFLPGMDASILVLCTNRHFTGNSNVYRCFGRFIGFRDGQGVSLAFILTVNSGSLKRIYYSKLYSLVHTLLLNVFSALKGTNFNISFAVTAAGVVLCGSPKKQPRTSSIVQFIFFLWSIEIGGNILRNQDFLYV